MGRDHQRRTPNRTKPCLGCCRSCLRDARSISSAPPAMAADTIDFCATGTMTMGPVRRAHRRNPKSEPLRESGHRRADRRAESRRAGFLFHAGRHQRGAVGLRRFRSALVPGFSETVHFSAYQIFLTRASGTAIMNMEMMKTETLGRTSSSGFRSAGSLGTLANVWALLISKQEQRSQEAHLVTLKGAGARLNAP